MNEPATFTFDHAEAKGKVEVSEGGYGVIFEVTAPDGTKYTGFLDLFHFSPEAMRGDPEKENCFQVVVDPVAGKGNTFHARFYPDGRVEVFSE